MDRYDFIRFGEQVGWYNESEDLMETMQVCCPVYPPVQGDTRVQLVSAGIEALQSGYGSEKTVRASQLVPFISHFGRGYWEALTQAADNGAGRRQACTLHSAGYIPKREACSTSSSGRERSTP